MDRLSLQAAAMVCRELSSVGDRILLYAQDLKEAGFSAFYPFMTYLESFCASDNEIRDHREYIIASAKNTLGMPWPMALRASADEKRLIYTSPVLEELRRRRDEMNGFPVEQLEEKFPGEKWRLEVDPSRRRMFRLLVTDELSYELHREEMLKQQRKILKAEVDAQGSDRDTYYSFDAKGRQAFLKEMMQHGLSSLGFLFDQEKSTSNFMIFSKKIIDQWDLCLTLEDFSAFLLNPREGKFVPSLQIRHCRIGGSVDKADSAKFLLIRYRHLIPGFGNAYWVFQSIADLELLVRAHLSLISFMLPGIFSSVEGAFRSLR